jgi:hypothetical protein
LKLPYLSKLGHGWISHLDLPTKKRKILSLKNGTTTLKTVEFTYGPDNQRKKMTSIGRSSASTLYTGMYQVNNGTQQLHYITGPEGLAALFVAYSNSSIRTVYYLQTICLTMINVNHIN